MWFPASSTGRAGLVSVVVLLNPGAIIFQGNVHPHLLNVGSKWFCMFHHSGGIVDPIQPLFEDAPILSLQLSIWPKISCGSEQTTGIVVVDVDRV